MATYYYLQWRLPGNEPFFFRGDPKKHNFFVPYISARGRKWGWVSDFKQARLFEGFPHLIFTGRGRNVSKYIEARWLGCRMYKGDILPTQAFRSIRDPSLVRRDT